MWKGSVGKRVELYLDLTGEDPQFAIGHGDGQYPVFAVGQSSPVVAVVLGDAVQRRLGATGTDTPAYGIVGCVEFSESEITKALGPGKEPRKEATTHGSWISASPVYDDGRHVERFHAAVRYAAFRSDTQIPVKSGW